MGKASRITCLILIGLTILGGCRTNKSDKGQAKRDRDRIEMRTDELRAQSDNYKAQVDTLTAENAQLKQQLEAQRRSK